MLSQEDIPVSSLWDLEMLGIRVTIEQNLREEKEKAVMSHFLETVRQKEDGRYEVHMPWKVDRAFLTDNYELCLKRLESTTRKLEKIGFREKYHEVFREWLAEGVISWKGVTCSYPLPSTPICHQGNIRNIFNEDNTGLRRFC
ncbi:uncharacterized protein TNCV_4566091 [Trichonephila clavipes]|nr:uncharacterized protein TNCV_4566091 [Trichonephila clavipes]